MKRSGFTMIELIFVIVILGILASVAIPKLAATRDDAKVSKALNEISTLKSDFASYYTSKGTFAASTITDETNVPLFTDNKCSTPATAIASGSTYYYCTQKTGTGNEPILSVVPTDANGNLAMAKVTASGSIGTAVQGTTTFKKIAVTQNLGGSHVTY